MSGGRGIRDGIYSEKEFLFRIFRQLHVVLNEQTWKDKISDQFCYAQRPQQQACSVRANVLNQIYLAAVNIANLQRSILSIGGQTRSRQSEHCQIKNQHIALKIRQAVLHSATRGMAARMGC